jgi:hypothetical protein
MHETGKHEISARFDNMRKPEERSDATRVSSPTNRAGRKSHFVIDSSQSHLALRGNDEHDAISEKNIEAYFAVLKERNLGSFLRDPFKRTIER